MPAKSLLIAGLVGLAANTAQAKAPSTEALFVATYHVYLEECTAPLPDMINSETMATVAKKAKESEIEEATRGVYLNFKANGKTLWCTKTNRLFNAGAALLNQ